MLSFQRNVKGNHFYFIDFGRTQSVPRREYVCTFLIFGHMNLGALSITGNAVLWLFWKLKLISFPFFAHFLACLSQMV